MFPGRFKTLGNSNFLAGGDPILSWAPSIQNANAFKCALHLHGALLRFVGS